MFKDVFLFRMINKIPIRNDSLRYLVASLICIGIIVTPKLLSQKVKAGHGYLDMETPEDIVKHRETQSKLAAAAAQNK
jgi:hypothetical protein